ncbi:MAG: hypothetical protein ACKVTZ_12125 [Bacteroidia bacterium]
MKKLFLIFVSFVIQFSLYGQKNHCNLYIDNLQMSETLIIELKIYYHARGKPSSTNTARIFKDSEDKYTALITNDTLTNFRITLDSSQINGLRNFEVNLRNQQLDGDSFVYKSIIEYKLQFREGGIYYNTRRDFFYNLFEFLLEME